jgi:hypothetical protein
MNNKTVEIIKIKRLDVPLEYVISDVDSLDELVWLRGKNQPIFESESDFFLVNEHMVFRYLKPDAKPRILKAQKVELNPDHFSAKIELTVEELFKFAKNERTFLLESSDCYIIPSDTVMFAYKGKSEVSKSEKGNYAQKG